VTEGDPAGGEGRPPIPPPRPRSGGLLGALQNLDDDGPDSVRDALLQAIGGVRGIIDSSLPTSVFVLGLVAGGLSVALIAALGSAALIALLRLFRHESLQQAATGLVGVAGAALVAYVLHSSAGFFLPGIVLNVLYAAAALGSVLAGRPFIGYVAALVEPRLAPWRSLPKVRRAAGLASLIWAGMFAARVAVQGPLYLAHRTALLGAAKIAMGWPLWGLSVGASYLLLRRALAGQEAPSTLPS
jgi:uncharacterized membrane protein